MQKGGEVSPHHVDLSGEKPFQNTVVIAVSQSSQAILLKSILGRS